MSDLKRATVLTGNMSMSERPSRHRQSLRDLLGVPHCLLDTWPGGPCLRLDPYTAEYLFLCRGETSVRHSTKRKIAGLQLLMLCQENERFSRFADGLSFT